jgi:hypothetical protein
VVALVRDAGVAVAAEGDYQPVAVTGRAGNLGDLLLLGLVQKVDGVEQLAERGGVGWVRPGWAVVGHG